MKIPSFRLRIALLSASLAGSALVGFGLVSWLFIYQTKLARLDSEIEGQLLREASPPRPVEHWPLYETSLPSFFGTDSQTPIALWVLDRDGKRLYQSQNWPSELDQNTLFPPQFDFRHPPPLPPEGDLPPPPPGQEEDFPPPGPLGEPLHPPFPEPPPLKPGERPQLPPIMTYHTETRTWRVGKVRSPFVQIAIAVSCDQIDREMSAIRTIFLISVFLILILVAIGAWLLSGSALKPLREVTTTLQQVTAKGLDQRIPSTVVDAEFLELIQVFNQMMERLERSFHQASRFSADAAHELKTPLAILQGELERTLQQADAGSELQQNLSSLLDEVRRLGSIVRKLLLLSLADAGQMPLHRVEIDLSEMLTDLAEDIEMLAPQLAVKLEIAPKLLIPGDRDLLVQVLQNLISNAIKYNLPSGWVQIKAKRQGMVIAVTVSNCSRHLPVKERERIFDRFYRGDAAHTRHIEGLGLGLSLSREIARAHGGELKLDLTPLGQTAFTLTFPIAESGCL
ncbi:MAG: ATP-binding protein [Actinomycetota bacterium]